MERVLEFSADLPKYLTARGTLLARFEEYAFAPLLKAVLLELSMIARVVARAVMCFIIVTNSMMESGDRIICACRQMMNIRKAYTICVGELTSLIMLA
jgi:hypothetical protein